MLETREKINYVPFYKFTKKKQWLLKQAIDEEEHEKIRGLFLKSKLDSGWEFSVEKEQDRAPVFPEKDPLRYAYQEKKLDVVMTLLDCEMDPTEQYLYTKGSLMMDLILGEDLEMLEKVLPYVEEKNGLFMFERDRFMIHTTYLGLCASLGAVKTAKLLMEHGCLMKPMTTKEALEGNVDEQGTYNGGFYVNDPKNVEYFGGWGRQLLEPWQFGVMCEDKEAAEWFLNFGEDRYSLSFMQLILHVRNKDVFDVVKQRFPKLWSQVCGKENVEKILKVANGNLMKEILGEEFDVSNLGKQCTNEEWIADCYRAMKERLNRELDENEKRQLVKLMLMYRSDALLNICEEEWKDEVCDVTEWAPLIPASSPKNKAFIQRLEGSSLRLTIHPENDLFDITKTYEVQSDEFRHMPIWFMENTRHLSVLEKVAQVISPPKDETLLPFTKQILKMGRKSAFQRAQSWGLIHERNMTAVMEFVVEQHLEQYYDQAIQSGEQKRNQKQYEL